MRRFRSVPARDTCSEAHAAPPSLHGRGTAAGGAAVTIPARGRARAAGTRIRMMHRTGDGQAAS